MQHTPTKNRLPTRLTAWLLALLMVATMLPASALATAEDGSTDPPPPAAETERQTPADPEPSAGADDPIPPEPPETPDNPDSPVGADDSVRPEPPETPDNPDPSAGADDPVPPETPADPETPLLTEEQTVSQPAMLAGTSGAVRFIFERDGYGSAQTIRLESYSYQFITECKPGAKVYTVDDQFKRHDFITTGKYVAYMYGSELYLKGTLNGACINLDQVSGSTAVVYVQEDTIIGGNHCLLYNYENDIDLRIRPGKTLTLNAQTPGQFRYMGAIRANGGDVTISGGGTLNINATGSTEAVDPRDFLSGIRGSNVTLENCTEEGFEGSPTVNILMDNRYSGPEGDKVIGISAGKLTVKDDALLRINVYGRALNTSNNSNTGEAYHTGNGGRSNSAINASSMELLDKASLTVFSYKNVISDICLGGSGEVLRVDTSGYLNIRNDGNIQRYALDGSGANDEMLAKYKDHPTSNIYCSAKDATVNLVRAEGGVGIVSYSSAIDDWYDDYYIDGKEDADNWAISCHGADPTLGNGMHRGSLRIGDSIQVETNRWIRNHGSIEYIWSPQGVATVQQSKGLIMKWHAPEDNPLGSSLYYAKVLKPELNDIRVVRKGDSLTLTTDGTKGKFLYWYDAQNPEGSENGTSWTSATQTFSNIQRDMVLVPVRDPMTTGPNLSAVGYSEQYDSKTSTYTRYAYQDLTFASEDDISNGTGGYRVMLVPAQLPRYGENTYAARDLDNAPVMGLRSSRLYADANAAFSVSALNNQFRNIPPGSYRIAYHDDDTDRCFISQPFTFDPPVASPYIDPGSAVFEEKDSGTKTVKITVERNTRIEYRVWNSSTNKWTNLRRYTDPFEVNVTAENDVRIEAYAGSSALGIKSEAYYSVRPSGVPTVKYGDTKISTTEANLPNRYFYGSIELTVEAPEGYEVWYNNNQAPYETSGGINGIPVEGGKVTLNYSGEFHFKLAKVVTMGGQKYRSLSHSVTRVKLVKQNDLPAPNVTVKTKEGGETLTPNGNTYTMTENVVTVTLASNGNWPLNATIAYDTNGNATPSFSKNYTKPFDVRGAGTISVFTLVPKANGEYEYMRKECTFKLAESLQKVQIAPDHSSCTVYYMKEDGTEAVIPTSAYTQELKVGTRVRVVPKTPSGQVFKEWEISNYDEYNIWGAYGAGDYHSPELIFYVPKPQYSSPTQTKILGIEATFVTAAEANISGVTLVGLDMSKTVNDSISLWDTTKEMRTISCQWWVGDSAGTEANALPGAVSFDPDKTYTVQVTIKTNPGASFAGSAGVAIGHYGGHFTVPNGKITRTGKDTLTFTATPIRQIDLTMPAPLTVGDPLPTIAQVGGVPAGVTAQALDWLYISGTGTTVPDDDSVRAALTLKTDGTRPILVDKYKYLTVNGEEYAYASNGYGNNIVTDGSIVKVNIDLPVKPKGVTVSGTVTSYGDAGENVTVTLLQGTSVIGSPQVLTGASGSVPYSQTYSFDTVPAGTYTLKVEKKGHAPWMEEITVDTAAIAKDVTVYLWGDVNKDGEINGQDLQRLYEHLKGENPLPAEDVSLGNVNGDDTVNGQDWQRLYEHVKGEKPLT